MTKNCDVCKQRKTNNNKAGKTVELALRIAFALFASVNVGFGYVLLVHTGNPAIMISALAGVVGGIIAAIDQAVDMAKAKP